MFPTIHWSRPTRLTPFRFLRHPFVLGALLLFLSILGVFLAWRRSPQPGHPQPSPPPDPRVTYTGPFLNIRPEVAYVGDAVCSDCHAEETRSYREHPMGRSLTPIRGLLDQIPNEGAEVGFNAFRSRFTVERQGERIWHRQTRLDADDQPLYTLESEVQFAIGSGSRGYSFLSEREGYLFQTPISWFSQKRVWGLSPGFTPALFVGRPVSAECLYCHAHRVRPRPNTDNGYEKPIFEGHAIGCERCHGPGERHVQERSKGVPVEGAIDYTIFNPSRRFLAEHENEKQAVLRDAVCEQCHLSGEVRVLRRGRDLYDFRPGLPLYSFWSVFVRDHRSKGTEKAVNHVEQMHLSRCYQESSGERKLECVSCHNPHEYVTGPQRLSYYRARCL